ncbi:MAG: sugar ABC transporter permease [Nitrososphaeria archaeon]
MSFSGKYKALKFYGYLFIIPCIVAIAFLMAYPYPFTFYLSLFSNMLRPGITSRFVGLANYLKILSDIDFQKALLLSFYYVLATSLGALIIGLFTALLFNRIVRGKRILRALILLPYVTPLVSTAYIWKYMFHPVTGIVNYFLVQLNIIEAPVNWIMDPRYAFTMVIIYDIWRYFPFSYLMILAALQAIDKTLYEAAEVDGAGLLQRFIHITLPGIWWVTATVFLIRCLWNLNKFDDIYLLTTGVVETVPVYAYLTAFSAYEFSKGAAILLLMAALTSIFLVIYLRKVLKW